MRQVLLLRGINLGPKRRVPMADLRRLLADAGLGEVATYVQSGNVVAEADEPPAKLAARCEQLIAAEFGFEVPVIVRSGAELAVIVERNPLAAVADDPKRYQVTPLEADPDPGLTGALEDLASAGERVVVSGREIYAWHPDGVARSKLWAKLGGRDLPVKATSRNWATLSKLCEMAAGL